MNLTGLDKAVNRIWRPHTHACVSEPRNLFGLDWTTILDLYVESYIKLL